MSWQPSINGATYSFSNSYEFALTINVTYNGAWFAYSTSNSTTNNSDLNSGNTAGTNWFPASYNPNNSPVFSDGNTTISGLSSNTQYTYYYFYIEPPELFGSINYGNSLQDTFYTLPATPSSVSINNSNYITWTTSDTNLLGFTINYITSNTTSSTSLISYTDSNLIISSRFF
jgi:hypothetical protein